MAPESDYCSASSCKTMQQISNSNLKKILSVNGKINSTLNIGELLGIIMQTASQVMETEAASLMLIDDENQDLVFKVALGEKGSLMEKFRVKIGEGISGTVAQSGKSEIVNDTLKDPRFASKFDAKTGFRTRSILCVPLRVKEKIIGVLQAINPISYPLFSTEHLELFETFADQAAIALENAKMHEAIVKQERTKRDLEIAHEIQQNFLPDLGQQNFSFDIDAKSIPALEIGGDFYQALRVTDSLTAVILGDVSGKGVPAALYMVRAITAFRFMIRQSTDTAEIIKTLNDSLCKETSFGMFITLVCLIIDHAKNELRYTSAGHHPILKRDRGSGSTENLPQENCLPVGLMEEAEYQENKFSFQKGDTFFIYTDGIIEARNKQGQEYSLDRMRGLAEKKSLSAKEYCQIILDDLKSFSQDAPQHDDITLLNFTAGKK